MMHARIYTPHWRAWAVDRLVTTVSHHEKTWQVGASCMRACICTFTGERPALLSSGARGRGGGTGRHQASPKPRRGPGSLLPHLWEIASCYPGPHALSVTVSVGSAA
eukprot:365107-Chlamydomonas_euryale.AAC.1